MSYSFAVVSLPALDLRSRPAHTAELGSQLLLGEIVRLGVARKGWRHVTNLADGYRGWVREWGLVPASDRRVRAWRRKARASVVAPLAMLSAGPRGGVGAGPVFFGSRAIPGRRSRGRIELELPDARRGWVDRSAVALPGDARPALAQRITSLLGSPYLWGGRTPAGYDCSAFVQQALLEQDVRLPRDAAQQLSACRRLDRGEEPVPGDLAFFAGRSGRIEHVGILFAPTLFVHSRGRVQFASLSPDNPLYDKELSVQLAAWGRPQLGAGNCRPDAPGAFPPLTARGGVHNVPRGRVPGSFRQEGFGRVFPSRLHHRE
ncbi:MAG: C40 family peptidase [Candidatus Eisenbacteria bacterium]|nr:C40 family peptidase [Candidatus Eisenbacteria bacterium]